MLALAKKVIPHKTQNCCMLLKISQYASMFTPLPSLQEQSLASLSEGSHGLSFPPHGSTICTGQGKDQRGLILD